MHTRLGGLPLYNTEQEETTALEKLEAKILKNQDTLLTEMQTLYPDQMNATVAAVNKALAEKEAQSEDSSSWCSIA